MIRSLLFSALLTLACPAQEVAATAADLWPVSQILAHPPAMEMGAADGLTQEVWYEGEPLAGKPTRIFAYLGKPAQPAPVSPAMLLVHGGGGRAFKEWAQHWAARGYVALAMDTAGQGPDGRRHADAGPDQSDATKFHEFTEAQARDQWSYHAVAAVLRGHALLKTLPGVDPERIGVTGISWGGYLTCLTAGVDHGLKVAVPVYGCGFLGGNSYWRDRSLAALTESSRERWLRLFDPSRAIGGATCPMLFLNGTHDFAYPPDSYRKTYALVNPEQVTLSVRVDLDHGHIWTFQEVDAFIDHTLRPGAASPALVRLAGMKLDGQVASVGTVGPSAPRMIYLPHIKRIASVDIAGGSAPVSAQIHFTAGTGAWQARSWQSAPATITGPLLSAPLPAGRPLTWFFTTTDARGLITSSPYAETGTSENTACLSHDKLENDFYDWNQRHAAVLAAKEKAVPEVVMLGDSITHLWGGEPNEEKGNRGAAVWEALFKDHPALNLGFGWDRTQNVLWRLDHGELRGLHPRHIVIHIGTNNLADTANARQNTAAEIAEGIQAVVERAKAQCPAAKITLMAVFPRGETPDHPSRLQVAAINALLPAVAKASQVTLLDIGEKFLSPDGRISPGIMPDFLHPSAEGYAIWAEALQPILNK